MLFVTPPGFVYCQGLTIEIVTSGVDFTRTVVVVDTLDYTIREGEKLPAFPGGPFG